MLLYKSKARFNTRKIMNNLEFWIIWLFGFSTACFIGVILLSILSLTIQ